jgi:6-phosphogluconolactonase
MNTFRRGAAHVEVWRDLKELSTRAAELFVGLARAAVQTHDAFTVALSGGSTPKALYELLATEALAQRINWSQTHVFWSDERCVPPIDPQSNYRMAHEALLSRVAIPAEQVHRMHGEDEPQTAAKDYSAVIEKHLRVTGERLYLSLLGMGDDGHTASLFPHSPVLDDTEHLVAAPYVEKLRAYRLTLTLRTLNHAAHTIFLVSGDAKARALRAVLEGDDDPHAWPARLVQPERDGELIWLVDEAAAHLLSSF